MKKCGILDGLFCSSFYPLIRPRYIPTLERGHENHYTSVLLSMCIIKRIKVSFCFGSDYATNKVNAAKPVSLITGSSFLLNKRRLRCRKSTNKNAPLRLLPSEKG
ncbi:MAG: hypothetical protein QS748_14895 [Candidatus Endonucleobacter bathymodioli]|uniref:Uncharacterized protein n=1 Tax=Candidatus Endonucleibacter bathymodioli TaxID=539814 RepID=A0AA90SUM1_9GAMM|nr:hypothetical protein [Candidatus Endonucleobacter bathymodioli]